MYMIMQQDWEGKREQALSLSLSPQSWPSGGGSAPVKSKQLLMFDFTESRNGLGWKLTWVRFLSSGEERNKTNFLKESHLAKLPVSCAHPEMQAASWAAPKGN